LTHRKARADLDPLTAWFVLAWDAFNAPQFSYDEALRLARACGVDLDNDVVKTLAEKKASNLVIWDSAKRAAKGSLGPADGSRGMIDAIHHAANAARNRTLADEFGGRMMCFSGRGGEILGSDGSWTVVSRDLVKKRFRDGEAEWLICTDAAAEGLNFQFCGALVNYDMPWNPMKVEQRIGRIDRLGQPRLTE
jgi:hypothetical protein